MQSTRFLNENDPTPVYELTEFDIPQRLVVSGTWELPFGPRGRFLRTAPGLVGKLLEGWQANGSWAAQSGVPITVTNAESLGRSAELPSSERTLRRWFDTSAFRLRETLELVSTARLPDVRTPGRN